MEIRSAISRDRIYTMRQLNQQTAEVLKEINEDGQPAMITRRGRFIAMIVPLANERIESAVVSAIMNEIDHSGQLTGERTLDNIRSTSDTADDLGLNLPSYPDSDG